MTPSTNGQTVRSLLRRGAALLVDNGVPNAQRNVEWLLCHTLDCSTLDLYAYSGECPHDDQIRAFWQIVQRRAEREPLQYIVGTTEFMSLAFEVPPGVFIPRPETETLIEVAEDRLRRMPLHRDLEVFDLCCGSGVVAVSLAVRVGNLRMVAVDNSAVAISTTRANAERNGVGDRVLETEAAAVQFLDAGDHSVSAIVCNPPYIATGELSNLPPEVGDHEPRAALDGGRDGLDFYRAVTPKLSRRLRCGGFVAFEIGDDQGAAVGGMMADAGFTDVSVNPDLAGRDRVVVGVKPSAP